MKRILALAVFSLVVAATLSFSQGPSTSPTAGDTKQVDLATKLDVLEKDLAATKAQLAGIQSYLQAEKTAATQHTTFNVVCDVSECEQPTS